MLERETETEDVGRGFRSDCFEEWGKRVFVTWVSVPPPALQAISAREDGDRDSVCLIMGSEKYARNLVCLVMGSGKRALNSVCPIMGSEYRALNPVCPIPGVWMACPRFRADRHYPHVGLSALRGAHPYPMNDAPDASGAPLRRKGYG